MLFFVTVVSCGAALVRDGMQGTSVSSEGVVDMAGADTSLLEGLQQRMLRMEDEFKKENDALRSQVTRLEEAMTAQVKEEEQHMATEVEAAAKDDSEMKVSCEDIEDICEEWAEYTCPRVYFVREKDRSERDLNVQAAEQFKRMVNGFVGNFSPYEFACCCCGECLIWPEALSGGLVDFALARNRRNITNKTW